jgi:hypothetical protein
MPLGLIASAATYLTRLTPDFSGQTVDGAIVELVDDDEISIVGR